KYDCQLRQCDKIDEPRRRTEARMERARGSYKQTVLRKTQQQPLSVDSTPIDPQAEKQRRQDGDHSRKSESGPTWYSRPEHEPNPRGVAPGGPSLVSDQRYEQEGATCCDQNRLRVDEPRDPLQVLNLGQRNLRGRVTERLCGPGGKQAGAERRNQRGHRGMRLSKRREDAFEAHSPYQRRNQDAHGHRSEPGNAAAGYARDERRRHRAPLALPQPGGPDQ